MAPQSAKKSPERAAGERRGSAAGRESAHCRRRGESVAAVHEVEQVRRPDDRERERADENAVVRADVRAGRHDGKRHREGRRKVNDESGRRRDASPIVDERHQRDRREREHPCPVRPAPAEGERSAAGTKPAQIASPPTRGVGRSCSDRALGAACGRWAETRKSMPTAMVETIVARIVAGIGERATGRSSAGQGRLEPIRAGEGITVMEAPPGPQKPFKTGPQWRGRPLSRDF